MRLTSMTPQSWDSYTYGNSDKRSETTGMLSLLCVNVSSSSGVSRTRVMSLIPGLSSETLHPTTSSYGVTGSHLCCDKEASLDDHFSSLLWKRLCVCVSSITECVFYEGSGVLFLHDGWSLLTAFLLAVQTDHTFTLVSESEINADADIKRFAFH